MALRVTKLVISGAKRLDPVMVSAEDLGSRSIPQPDNSEYVTRQGKIPLERYGESWSAYWGGMGSRTVAEFFCGCDEQYLAGCLVRGTELHATQFSGQALQKMVRKIVIERRRGRSLDYDNLDKDEARELQMF